MNDYRLRSFLLVARQSPMFPRAFHSFRVPPKRQKPVKRELMSGKADLQSEINRLTDMPACTEKGGGAGQATGRFEVRSNWSTWKGGGVSDYN